MNQWNVLQNRKLNNIGNKLALLQCGPIEPAPQFHIKYFNNP